MRKLLGNMMEPQRSKRRSNRRLPKINRKNMKREDFLLTVSDQ
jgi:hypothetical protein